MNAKLKIFSEDPDWCGQWDKKDVLEEMKDVGIEVDEPEKQWLNWVFDHNFEDVVLPQEQIIETFNALKKCEMLFKLDDMDVRIIYEEEEEEVA